MVKRFLLIVLLFIISLSTISCGDKDTDEIVLNPNKFKLSLLNVNSELANIEWQNSSIADKSNLVYDVYLNGELKETNIISRNFIFNLLTEDTEYNVRIVAKSIYKTNEEAILRFKTSLSPAPSPLILKSDKILVDEITVSWTKTDTKDVLFYDIYLNGELKDSNISSENYTFYSLIVNTEYEVKIIGRNNYDKTIEITSSFTTPDYLEPIDFELSCSNIKTSEARIVWSSSDLESQLASGITYKVFVNGKEIVSDLTINSYVLLNLNPSTKYSIIVKAINRYGKVKEKNIFFNTMPLKIKEKISDFDIIIDEIGRKLVRFHVETLGDENAVGIFKVYVGNSYVAKLSNKQVFTYNNIIENTDYTLRVVAENAKDESREKSKNFVTKPAPTLSDFTVSTKEIGASTATLQWTPCIASDGSKVTYNVYYLNGASAKSNIIDLEFIIPVVLRPATAHRYRVVACYKDGILRKEKFVDFTTENYEQASDFTISYENLTPYSVNIKWTESIFPSGDGIIYEISKNNINYSRNARRKWTFNDLQPATSYVIKVIAKAAIPGGNPNKAIKEMRFTTPALFVPEINNIVKNVGKRNINISWSLDLNDFSYLELRSYKILFNNKEFSLGSAKTWSNVNLISNTSYNLIIEAAYYDTQSHDILYVKKDVEFKTAEYPSVHDYNLETSLPFYHRAIFNLSDFNVQNSSIYDDLSSMNFEILLDGEINYKGIYKEEHTFEGLNPESNYEIKLIVRHSDGTLISEKTHSFTTSTNHAPIWSDELELKSVGFSYASFKNVFASDEEDALGINSYEYYINEKKYNEGHAIGNARHNGQVEVRANDRGEDIVITHLEANRDQTFSINAIDKAGAIISTKTVNFTTTIDARQTFHIDGIKDEGTEVLYPVWSKMGNVESIKQIYIQWILNGKLDDGRDLVNEMTAYKSLGDANQLIDMGIGYSISIPVNAFIGQAGIRVSCRIRIEWKDPECLRASISNLLDIR